jgi:2-polyprenyl-3-methyl-5-hydroxy-6-metoxy-1,4-benzoquinol methylase
MGRVANDEHKGAQAAYYDHHAAEEFEIARPNDSPAFYDWLMREKFRRSLTGIVGAVEGTVALTVGGGSGMEAQFLVEAGFDVIASDLSLGAAQRCQERARRFNLNIASVVADVERLPFRDRSVPLVYVHDGLHHLADPITGLTEMARVAACAISITEPAAAAVTSLAVRLGLARAYEEPGNPVARIRPAEVEAALLASGFDVIRTQRYAMYYRHQPGQVFRFLSNPRVMPIARAATHAVNLVAGQWGNKVAVKALRSTACTSTVPGKRGREIQDKK